MSDNPKPPTLDPLQEKMMGPDYSRDGIFVYHNCWKCKSGEKPCVVGNPRQCEHPHARND